MKIPAITVVGSNMVDLLSYLDRCPQPGETVFGRNFVQGLGGKGANQAVMAALLGARVRMVTCVGRDAFTAAWLEHFAAHRIDAAHVDVIDGVHSGTASIWVSSSGENMIVLGAGANAQLDRARVARAFASDLQVDVVLSQLEVAQPAIAEGFLHGRRLGAINVLNPGPAAPLDRDLLPLIDWLLPNQTELRLLAYTMCGLSAADDLELAQRLADALGIQIVVTLGARGAGWASPGSTPFEVAAPVVAVVDTTGAGDAFAGTFAYALGAGMGARDAVRVAVAVSADSVTRAGTAVSFSRDAALLRLCREVVPDAQEVDTMS
jgi:ribokinase